MSKELFTVRWMGTGDRRWSHPVTICTGSHASYSDRTQMPCYNMSLYADTWMCDKMLRATLHGMSTGFGQSSILFFLYKLMCVFVADRYLELLSFNSSDKLMSLTSSLL